jgi:acetyl esterase/lipase
MTLGHTLITAVLLAPVAALHAAEKVALPVTAPNAPAKPATAPLPQATRQNVAYGTDKMQVLNLWKAASDHPTPLVFHIHGGAWRGAGRMSGLGPTLLPDLLKAGISVVSIEYRFTTAAQAAGVKPPVKWPLEDAARALQFVRSKAVEWNIDRARIGLSGVSAGACSALWLAFHPDLADPKSSDPIAHESTRPWCVAVADAQTTLDPQQMKEWTPNSFYGGHAFGFTADKANSITEFQAFLQGREQILPWIAEYSPYALVSAGAPPIYLHYDAPPALGKKEKDPTHTANFGVKLQERCRSVGVDCDVVYPGAPVVKHATTQAYLIEKLTAPAK